MQERRMIVTSVLISMLATIVVELLLPHQCLIRYLDLKYSGEGWVCGCSPGEQVPIWVVAIVLTPA